MIDLCVINYNTKHLLARLLDTLFNQSQLPSPNYAYWNLYIADNGSTDGSVEMLKEHEYKDHFTFVENDNIGYSAACNQLAAMGEGNIVGLLNSDVWLTTSDVIAIEHTFLHNLNQHIMGPKQRDENGYVRHGGIIGTNTKPRHRGWNEHDAGDILYRDRIPCVTVSGSAYFVRRDVWEAMTNHPDYQKVAPGATGAFLPTPHYYEETWCSYFARHLGYEVWYDGSISMGHSWHASSPVGGEADQKFKISQRIFREACDTLGIARD